jgi:dienelactone hydrolase
MLLACTSITAQVFPIGHTQITYTDPARGGRSIQTEIYYPATSAGEATLVAGGTFPVIVFGHGFVMTWDAYQNFWTDLVPQGYILAFPRTEGSISPVHAEFGKDLAFLVTKLQSESSSNASSLFYNHVNSKSAIMGHSMGGGSSFLAAANNTLITTMVSFAAANTSPSSITAAQNVSVPSLVFSGQNDCVAPTNAHQQKMYDSLASSCKTFINVKGGAHCEFANNNFNCNFGQSTCSPSPTITRAQQQDVTSDFLKLWLAYYLKDDCASRTIFNDSLVASPRITYQQSCAVYSNPVISQAGSILQSTSALTYQWYLNGSVISGANSQTYTYSAPGTYHVEVTYGDNCPYISNTIIISSTSLQEQAFGFSDVMFYPNPSNSEVNISLLLNASSPVTLEIYNSIGQLVEVQKNAFVLSNGRADARIGINHLVNGMYVFVLKSNTTEIKRTIIKE